MDFPYISPRAHAFFFFEHDSIKSRKRFACGPSVSAHHPAALSLLCQEIADNTAVKRPALSSKVMNNDCDSGRGDSAVK
eukprot:scaffold76156_cov65-Attheya_sp.AAC.3